MLYKLTLLDELCKFRQLYEYFINHLKLLEIG